MNASHHHDFVPAGWANTVWNLLQQFHVALAQKLVTTREVAVSLRLAQAHTAVA